MLSLSHSLGCVKFIRQEAKPDTRSSQHTSRHTIAMCVLSGVFVPGPIGCMGLSKTTHKMMCKCIFLVKGTIAFIRFSIGPCLPLKKKKDIKNFVLHQRNCTASSPDHKRPSLRWAPCESIIYHHPGHQAAAAPQSENSKWSSSPINHPPIRLNAPLLKGFDSKKMSLPGMELQRLINARGSIKSCEDRDSAGPQSGVPAVGKIWLISGTWHSDWVKAVSRVSLHFKHLLWLLKMFSNDIEPFSPNNIQGL